MNCSNSSRRWAIGFSDILAGLIVFALFAAVGTKAAGLIDEANRFVWSETTGWINFAAENQSVSVVHSGTNRFITGNVWGENIGYIQLSASSNGPFSNTTATNWGINLSQAGVLSGFAWGENVGWINFGGSNSLVKIDSVTGLLQGYAWGENIGWIRFHSDTNASTVYGLKVDSSGPKVTITSPKSNERFTNVFNVTMNGTASDVGVGLSHVVYRLNGGSFSSATGTTNWSASLALVPGTNRVDVKSVDFGGNESPVITRSFFMVTYSLFTLTSDSFGQVVSVASPFGTPTNGALLEVGRSYNIVAIPNANYLFSNWTGSASFDAQNLTFMMQSNMVLHASFVTNSFNAAAGVYNGLFSEGPVRFNSAGFATLKVTPKQKFSGKLMVDGDTVAFSGNLLVDGTATVVSKTRNKKTDKPELTVSLALDFSNGTLTGTIGEPGDEGWTSALLAYRAAWTTNVAGQATAFTNAYTMLLTNDAMGSGYGGISIDKLGKTKLSGRLADGHVLKQSTVISKDGYWPMFGALYKQKRTNNLLKAITETKGFALGWLQFTNNNGLGNLAPAGGVHWIKTSWTNQTYAAGITNTIEVTGSRWLPPVAKSGIRAIAMTNALLSFSSGDLQDPFSATYFVTTNTTLALIKLNDYPNAVKASMSPKTGLLSGKFVHPQSGIETKWFGALLQDQNYGEGFFMGPVSSGKVTATPKE